MKKRTLYLIMAGLLLASAMVSCSDNSSDNESESKSPTLDPKATAQSRKKKRLSTLTRLNPKTTAERM